MLAEWAYFLQRARRVLQPAPTCAAVRRSAVTPIEITVPESLVDKRSELDSKLAGITDEEAKLA